MTSSSVTEAPSASNACLPLHLKGVGGAGALVQGCTGGVRGVEEAAALSVATGDVKVDEATFSVATDRSGVDDELGIDEEPGDADEETGAGDEGPAAGTCKWSVKTCP
jgi:hypothetical protein